MYMHISYFKPIEIYVFSKWNTAVSTRSRKNQKGSVTTFLPRTQGGGAPTPALGLRLWGQAASTCCYQPFFILPRLIGK